MTNRSQKFRDELPFVIFHWSLSLVILLIRSSRATCHCSFFQLCILCGASGWEDTGGPAAEAKLPARTERPREYSPVAAARHRGAETGARRLLSAPAPPRTARSVLSGAGNPHLQETAAAGSRPSS